MNYILVSMDSTYHHHVCCVRVGSRPSSNNAKSQKESYINQMKKKMRVRLSVANNN